MSKQVTGIVVSGEDVVVVILEVNDGELPVVVRDETWRVQTGDRIDAYRAMHERTISFFRQNPVSRVLVKASALGKTSAKLAHLHSAELRGVVLAAAAACGKTKAVQKASLSRTFGKRKVDDYLIDENFWSTSLSGGLRKGSREAAIVALSDIE